MQILHFGSQWTRETGSCNKKTRRRRRRGSAAKPGGLNYSPMAPIITVPAIGSVTLFIMIDFIGCDWCVPSSPSSVATLPEAPRRSIVSPLSCYPSSPCPPSLCPPSPCPSSPCPPSPCPLYLSSLSLSSYFEPLCLNALDSCLVSSCVHQLTV